MRRSRSIRGEGKVGFFIAIIVVAATVYAAMKFVPVYVAAYDLKDLMRRETQGASLQTNAQIQKVILKKCEELGLPVDQRNIRMERSKIKFVLEINFDVPIDMALFTYTYKFREKEEAPLF